uniref:YEATS domain-containing protein n=1 Tax=Euplotes crassus TaxID=5936 RepID=A0A7S3NSW9_EUPCR|mmetsp:Transcript_17484/g.17243  ORF Transcript_17484/g.17243 Transcript_17484/m.17243 type:complete len:171 (+) Transcript_17484:154-666(+)|eukprot:CAMPEP_0196998010 /NCGR_PEP_ID=MMETSP1380-20130617/3505_1 /TAXON_ID=5936 /ORGANISM="Euplotes crassus, Strain CT5" /LENGTH=170 /DNA_ID=CAMNT_0042414443 /DNA_START=174 /DNA_END=686 /DNA_ORIENTATION=-
MCREGFEEGYIPDIDKEFQKEVRDKMPEEFKETTAFLKENNLFRGNLKSIKFFFGNKHKEIQATAYMENDHEWIAFVEFVNPEYTKRFVSKVEFKLHPTFQPSKVTVDRMPFQIKRIGWGIFEIKITITWRHWMKKEPTKYTHMLSFDGDGKRNAFIVDVPKDMYDNAMA